MEVDASCAVVFSCAWCRNLSPGNWDCQIHFTGQWPHIRSHFKTLWFTMEKLKLPESASHMQKKSWIFLLSLLTWDTFPFMSSRKFIFEQILTCQIIQKGSRERVPVISCNTCCRGPSYFNNCYLGVVDRITDTFTLDTSNKQKKENYWKLKNRIGKVDRTVKPSIYRTFNR